jgi:hypothetical protein
MGMDRVKKFISNTVNQRFFYNPRFERVVESLYYSPDKNHPSVPISATAQKYLEEFRENGVVIIPAFRPDVADAINEQHFAVLEGKRQSSPGQTINLMDLGERNANSGTTSGLLSYRDPLLQPVLWDTDLCGLVYNYYQRQPYYRDQPAAILNAPSGSVSQEIEFSSKFHLDLFHQITFQFLVNDLTPSDTRLQYAVGSHLERKFGRDRFAYDDRDVSKRYAIRDCVGPKGTMVIMDAGAGLHRGTYVPGTVRKMIHTIITTGHSMNIYGKIDSVAEWKAFPSFPPFMQKMMDRVAL